MINSLTRPLTSPLCRAITDAGVGGFYVGSLFAAGEQGAIFDWSDTTTTYQDSAGSTAGVVGQVDGLTLDKRLGLVRGAELVSNGGLDSGTGWTAGTGWTIAGGVASASGSTADGLRDSQAAYVTGKAYEVQFDKTGTAQVTVYVRGSAAPFATTASGTSRAILVAGASGTRGVEFYLTGAGSVDNVSVREVPGSHITQPTTALKPILQAGYASFDAFDDFMAATTGGGGTTGILLCAGIRASAAGSARTLWSDTGTNTGYKLTLSAANALTLSAGNGTSYTSVTGPTITAGTDYVVQAWHDGTNLRVRVGLAATTSAAFVTATAGTAGFTIGRDNGAATSLYGDRIYCLAYRKNDTSTAAQRDSLARWAASKSNVTL